MAATNLQRSMEQRKKQHPAMGHSKASNSGSQPAAPQQTVCNSAVVVSAVSTAVLSLYAIGTLVPAAMGVHQLRRASRVNRSLLDANIAAVVFSVLIICAGLSSLATMAAMFASKSAVTCSHPMKFIPKSQAATCGTVSPPPPPGPTGPTGGAAAGGLKTAYRLFR